MSGRDELFERLRVEYLTDAPLRLGELREDLAALRAGSARAAASLKVRLHRLAGSGGSYGFPDISALAREAEGFLAAQAEPDAERIEAAIAGLADAFGSAARRLGLDPEPGQPREAAPD